jgi:hypothetical protein
MREPGFYYSLAYCACVAVFGLRRMRRRKTPYIRAQTWTLIAIQLVPLFLLPYLVLPGWAHSAGLTMASGARSPTRFSRRRYGHGRDIGAPLADPRLAALHLECLHGAADVDLAGYLVSSRRSS